jgi:hypothetical protein
MSVLYQGKPKMKVTGGCHCGRITYEAEVDPATIRVCHCTDCQRLTGTAFRVNISAQPEAFKLRSGIPKNYVRTAESGNKCAHAFCPECGTPIYVTPSEPSPSAYRLALGAIVQRAQFGPPSRQIWYCSVLPWSMDLRAVEKSDRQ